MSLKRSFAFFLQTNKRLLHLQSWTLLLPVLFYSQLSFAAFPGLGDTGNLIQGQNNNRQDDQSQDSEQLRSLDEGDTQCDKAQKKVRSECHVGSMSAIVRSPGSTLEALYLADQNVQSCFDSSKECLKSCGYNGSVKTDDLFSFLSSLSGNKVISLAEEDHYHCIKPAHKLAQAMGNKNSIGATCTDFLKKLEEKSIVSETKRLLESRCEKTNRFSKAEVKLRRGGGAEERIKCVGGTVVSDKCLCKGKSGAYTEAVNGICDKKPPNRPDKCEPNEERINGQCVVKCQNGLVRDANGKCQKSLRAVRLTKTSSMGNVYLSA